jgi:mannose-6-phosphate isomerase-like protein (cupin superfamily)
MTPDSSNLTENVRNTHLRSGGGTAFDLLGIRNEWKLRSADTGGLYCVLQMTVPPGMGVPPHQHVYHEAFFFLEGAVEFAREENRRTTWLPVAPGDMMNVPSWAIHGFRNVGERPARVLLTCAPEVEAFFDQAGVPVEAGMPLTSGPPSLSDIQRVMALAVADGQRFVPPEA